MQIEWIIKDLHLPYDKSLSKNRANKVTRLGKFYKDINHIQAKRSIAWELSIHKSKFPINVKIWIGATLYKPRSNIDCANQIDGLFDAIEEGLGIDDHWFSIYRFDWQIDRKNPRIILSIGVEY